MCFAFSATMRAATCIALPAVTAPRDANVPTPHGKRRVSPLVTSTSRTSTPSSSATTCAHTVACAWPWLGMPVAATTLPDTSTCTCAPSYGPTPVPSTYMPRPMPTLSPAGLRAQLLERLLQQRRIVAAVVDDHVAVLPRDADLVGKLVGLDEVAPAHLGPVEAELGGDRVQRALHDEACVRAAGAAIGRRRRRVRVHVAEANAVVRHPVRAGHLGRGDDRQDDPVGRVGAAVVDEVVVEREHPAVVVEADLDLVDLAALLVHRGEVLLPVLGPLDRTAELHRRVRDQQLVGVEEHDLRPEAAADVGRDDLDLRLGQPEQHREAAADRGRRLRRVVDGQLAFAVDQRAQTARALHRAGGAALVSEAAGACGWARRAAPPRRRPPPASSRPRRCRARRRGRGARRAPRPPA